MKVFLYNEMDNLKRLKSLLETEIVIKGYEATASGYVVTCYESSISILTESAFREVSGHVYDFTKEQIQTLINYYGNVYAFEPITVVTEDGDIPKQGLIRSFVTKNKHLPVQELIYADVEDRVMRFVNTYMQDADERRSCSILLNTMGAYDNLDEYIKKYPYNIRRFKLCGYSYSSLFNKMIGVSTSVKELTRKLGRTFSCSPDCVSSIVYEGYVTEKMYVKDIDALRNVWKALTTAISETEVLPDAVIKSIPEEVDVDSLEILIHTIDNQPVNPFMKWVYFSTCLRILKLPIVDFNFNESASVLHVYMNKVYEVYEC